LRLPRPHPLEAKFRPWRAGHEADQCRTGAQPARHLDPLPADATVFANPRFQPARLYKLCRSKAYLFRGVEIRCPAMPPCSRASRRTSPPRRCCISRGLRDSLEADIGNSLAFCRKSGPARPICRRGHRQGRMAVVWLDEGEDFCIPTATRFPRLWAHHETGFRAALSKAYAPGASSAATSVRRRSPRMTRSIRLRRNSRCSSVSRSFRPDQGETDQFRGDPTDRNRPAGPVRSLVGGDPASADNLLAFVIERQRNASVVRKPKIRRGSPPRGDCGCRQADRLHQRKCCRNRDFPGRGRQCRWFRQAGAQPRHPAILPLRGKILNVARPRRISFGKPGATRSDRSSGCGVGDASTGRNCVTGE